MAETTLVKEAKTEDKAKTEEVKAMFKVTVKAMVKEAINDTVKEMDKITLAMP